MTRSGRLLLGALALTASSLLVLDFGGSTLSEGGAVAMLQGLGQPDLSLGALTRVTELAVHTLAVAVFGTGLGAAAGLVLAVLGSTAAAAPRRSRVRRALAESVRLGLDGLRALPDFVWALGLLLVLGPGPITGALAIALSVTGILGRAFGQLLESVPARAVASQEGLGGPPVAAIVYGRLPRVASAAWSYGLARLECSVRNASVIGIVGGGGLGAELFEELGYGRMDRVATLLLGLVVLTATADTASAALRRRISSARAAQRRVALRLALGAWLAAVVWLGGDLLALGETLQRVDSRLALETLRRLGAPDLSWQVMRELFWGAGAPLALAWLATAIAAAVAVALLPWTSTVARWRTRGPRARPNVWAVGRALALRTLALLARAVPEVAWLLLFAAALGMGPLPALLALTLHATGVLIRLFTEAVDDRFAARPRDGVGPGATTGWLVYAALPRLRGHMVTHAALQAESNLRTAFTLGILGAGGLGEAFHGAISYWQLERASTLALGMLVLFVGLDRAGRALSRNAPR